MANIDKLCAQIGFKIPNEDWDKSKQENVIQKALSILSEDGIFAFWVWLDSEKGEIKEGNLKPENKSVRSVAFHCVDLLKNTINFPNEFELNDILTNDQRCNDFINKVREKLIEAGGMLEDIHRMFLIKQLLERTLTYAFYRARALP
ncbi:MAG: hypothetical protein QME54_01715 [Actinomycetota bacterium]|nr:hypothetical protein [Actinomycetota bacterium]